MMQSTRSVIPDTYIAKSWKPTGEAVCACTQFSFSLKWFRDYFIFVQRYGFLWNTKLHNRIWNLQFVIIQGHPEHAHTHKLRIRKSQFSVGLSTNILFQIIIHTESKLVLEMNAVIDPFSEETNRPGNSFKSTDSRVKKNSTAYILFF